MKDFAIALVSLLLWLNPANGQVADTVYTNGKIYTVNDQQPWAEALAIKDGKFIAVGTAEEIKSSIGDDTEVVDLGGKFVMPGIHDTHLHFESFYTAEMLEGKMLRFTSEQKTIEDLQKALKEYADNNPDLRVLFAEQLPLALFPNLSPTKDFIEEVVPDRPVVMLTDTEHEAVLNSKAMAMEGITANTPVPEGGEIVLDPHTRQPTGFLKESAAGRWGWVHYPNLTREQHLKGMHTLVDYLNSVGITSGKQQHAKNPVATAFQDLEKAGELSMRIALSWTYKGPLEPMPLKEQETMIENRKQFASDLIDTEFVKLSMDGTAGTTGLVVDPYEGNGGRGIAFYKLDDLGKDIARFDAMGMGVTAHASGDGAVRLFLDGLDAAKKINGQLKARHQIAHAHFVHPNDIHRIRELDATVEFSPVMWFQSGLTEGLATAIGKARMAHAFPAQSVLQSGGRVVFASDGPLFWQEPLHALEAAVTRTNPTESGKSLAIDEAVDLATAIKAYTLESAYLMNQEDEVGSIATGRRADMVVLDTNLFEVVPSKISDANVLTTVFDGKVVFDRSRNPSTEVSIEDHHQVQLDLTGKEGHRCCIFCEMLLRRQASASER